MKSQGEKQEVVLCVCWLYIIYPWWISCYRRPFFTSHLTLQESDPCLSFTFNLWPGTDDDDLRRAESLAASVFFPWGGSSTYKRIYIYTTQCSQTQFYLPSLWILSLVHIHTDLAEISIPLFSAAEANYAWAWMPCFPSTSYSSSWGTVRCFQSRWDIKSLQHVFGLPWVLIWMCLSA